MSYNEYQKKEIGWGLNAFNRPVEYSGITAWVRLITQILFTRPGTYPTAPALGVGLQDYRYRFLDDVKVELEEKINYQVRVFLPGLPIGSVQVSSESVNGTEILILQFEFRLSDNNLQTAFVAVDIASKTLNYEVAF